jgi:hypothetical protein
MWIRYSSELTVVALLLEGTEKPIPYRECSTVVLRVQGVVVAIESVEPCRSRKGCVHDALGAANNQHAVQIVQIQEQSHLRRCVDNVLEPTQLRYLRTSVAHTE